MRIMQQLIAGISLANNHKEHLYMKHIYLFLFTAHIASAEIIHNTFQDFDESGDELPNTTTRAVPNMQFQNMIVQNSATIHGNIIVNGTITANSIIDLTSSCTADTLELDGDVVGSFTANTVSFVGGQSAANIAAATILANAATANNIPNSIVKRDSNRFFAAEEISAVSINALSFLESTTISTRELSISEKLDTVDLNVNNLYATSDLEVLENSFYVNIQRISPASSGFIFTIAPNKSLVLITPTVPINNVTIEFPTTSADTNGLVVTITWRDNFPSGSITYVPGIGKTVINAINPSSSYSSAYPSATFIYVHQLLAWVRIG